MTVSFSNLVSVKYKNMRTLDLINELLRTTSSQHLWFSREYISVTPLTLMDSG